MKKPNFKFPLQNKNQLNFDGKKTNIVKRFFARRMAYLISVTGEYIINNSTYYIWRKYFNIKQKPSQTYM